MSMEHSSCTYKQGYSGGHDHPTPCVIMVPLVQRRKLEHGEGNEVIAMVSFEKVVLRDLGEFPKPVTPAAKT